MFKFLLLLLTAAAPIHLDKSVNPELSVLEEEQRDGYKCQLVEYNVSRSERVRSFLLIPDSASAHSKRPGLVLLHDHGARFDIGKEKLVKPLPSAPSNIKISAQQWIDDNFDGVYYGDKLASMGYVVIVPDVLYWGGRSTELCRKWSRMKFCGEAGGDIDSIKTRVYEGQRTVYDNLYRKGVIWAEQTLDEDAAAAGLLKTLDCVDKRQIGAFGWSMGAHRCWLLAAFCKDVKTGVALCWMTLKETSRVPLSASDYSMLIPEMRDKYDFPDIAGWLAPKPFFFLSGLQDKLFPAWSVQRSFAWMREYYKMSGEPDNLKAEFFDGPHHCGIEVQKRISDYLQEQLPIRP